MDKVWLIDLVIDGERVLDLFNQKTANLAAPLLSTPNLSNDCPRKR